MRECERIIGFYGHLEIECAGSLGLRAVESRVDVAGRRAEIESLRKEIIT